ncbi:hypothetical protein EMGBS3_04950 [Anaerolineaceae bacterium]|nr:hypothetical protein EMGBS3_04950 [Anaerolineaceae bacterium]
MFVRTSVAITAGAVGSGGGCDATSTAQQCSAAHSQQLARRQPDRKHYKRKHAMARILEMRTAQTPRWIRRVVGTGFAALLILIAGTAAALRAGAADERGLGVPVWQTDFAPDRASDWQIIADASATPDFGASGLVLAMPNADAHAVLLRAAPPTPGHWRWMLRNRRARRAQCMALHSIAFLKRNAVSSC